MSLKNILFIIGLLLILPGCSTNEKFSVYVPTGTKVYTPYDTQRPAAEASYSDKVKISVPSDMYCGYLLVQPQGSDVRIPMGLDYKISHHTGTKAALYAGMTVSSVGVGTALIGCIALVAASSQEDEENSETFGQITALGAAAAGIGAAVGMPAQARLRQTAFDYNFGYEKKQRLTLPNLSQTLINPNPPKGADRMVEKASPRTERKKATSGTNATTKTSPSGTKVSRSRSDFGKKIAGEYIGTGSLLYGKKADESYDEIAVLIERIDKNHVSVRVIESDEDYFDTPLTYVIKSNKTGGYTLSIEKLPEATIQISKDGKLTFKHGKVNIENQIYTLNINAVRTE